MRSLIVVLSVGLVLCGCAQKESRSLAQTYAAEAAIALDSGKYSEAKAKAIKATEAKPEVAEYSVAVAFAAVKLNEPSVAKEYFNKALAILEPQSKTDPERVDDCAMILICLGRKEEAVTILNKGVKQFPNSEVLKKLHGNVDAWTAELSEYSIGNAEQSAR